MLRVVTCVHFAQMETVYTFIDMFVQEMLIYGYMSFDTCRLISEVERLCADYWQVLILNTGQAGDFPKLLKTERNLLYIRIQPVPRCKHF